jgi:hypothetical protein
VSVSGLAVVGVLVVVASIVFLQARRAGKSVGSALLFAALAMLVVPLPIWLLVWWGRRAGERRAA